MKRFLVGGCAALLVMASCADDPSVYLSGPAGPATRMQLSTGALSMIVGDAVVVGAAALDAVGNPTGDVPTFAACSGAPVSIAAGTAEGLYSAAATITAATSTVGAGCVTVSVGGVSDTIHVEVGPAGITITGADTVGSGETNAYAVAGFDRAGGAVTGTAPYTWSSSNTARITTDAVAGAASGRSPGAVTLRVRGPGGSNGIKALIVAPGAFGGTVSATAASAGAQIRATKGANDDDYDGNSTATYGGFAAYFEVISPNELLVALPTTGVAGAQNLDMLNMGSSETARRVSITAGSAFDDTYGVANEAPATAPAFTAMMSPGGYVYFSHAGYGTGSAARGVQNGGPQPDHYFLVTAGPGGATLDQIRVEWLGAGGGDDFDLIICDTATETDCSFGFSGSTTNETVTNVVLAANTEYYIAVSCWVAANDIRNMRLRVTGTGF